MKIKDSISEGDTFKGFNKKQIEMNYIVEERPVEPKAKVYRVNTLSTKATRKQGNKCQKFVKNHPYTFLIILLGCAAIITISIVVPIVLGNKGGGDNKTKIPKKNGMVTDTNTESSHTEKETTEKTETTETTKTIVTTETETTKEPKTNTENEPKTNTTNITIEEEVNFTDRNPLEFLSKTEPDNITKGVKNSDLELLDTFCNYLSTYAVNLTDPQKIYLAYNWVASNIKFDVVNDVSTTSGDIDLNNVFKNKKSVAVGYSKLYSRLLKAMGYNEKYIVEIFGYGKRYDYDPETGVTNYNHHWNVIKVNDTWCLVDTTWGSGIADSFSKTFTPFYDEYYLCTPPYQFVRTHLPPESQKKYQLLVSPLSKEQFVELAETKIDFFKIGFYMIKNDKYKQNQCTPGNITIYSNEEIGTKTLSVELYEVKNSYSSIMKIDHILIIKKKNKEYEVNFQMNLKGKYTLNLSSNSKLIAIFSLESSKDSSPAFEFPEYASAPIIYNDLELFSPLNYTLNKGQTYTFSLRELDSSNLFLRLYCENIQMKKNGNLFSLNDIWIHGDSVEISYKISTMNGYEFKPIISYKTQGVDPSFPSCNIGDGLIRLISPKKNPLKMGSSYIFSIESLSENNFFVVISRSYKLEKSEGNIYSLNITIPFQTTTDKLLIYIKKSATDQIKIIEYDLSS